MHRALRIRKAFIKRKVKEAEMAGKNDKGAKQRDMQLMEREMPMGNSER